MKRHLHIGIFLAAIACISMSPAAAQFSLVSEKQELQAGQQADQELMRKYRSSGDRYWNSVVKNVGTRLVRACERPNIPWTFRVLDSNELNAFSVPGYVYITTATLETIRNDQDAIAGVLAHEIGHTCGRHAKNQMEKGAIGGLLISVLGGKNKTVSGLAGVAANLIMLGYSRNDENDADKRAVRYTMASGYDPNGLVRFFQILESKGDSGGGGVASYFRTHPPTGDRISRVRNEIARQGGSTNSNAYRRSRPRNIDYPNDPNYRDRYRDDSDPYYRDRYNRDRYNRDRSDWP
jgi:predicted Zn-dependent protease